MTQKAEVKQSPAPTVSTILYFFNTPGFILVATFPWIYNLSVIIAEPLVPNFNTTFKLGYFDIILFLISYTGLSTSTFGFILSTYV